MLLAAIAAVGAAALAVNIFERKQEARNPFYRVVELTDTTVDPAIWGKNFPLQYDDYKRTVDMTRTKYGGSDGVPRAPTATDPRTVTAQSRLEEDPRLRAPCTASVPTARGTCCGSLVRIRPMTSRS